jgi:hypothetical protein
MPRIYCSALYLTALTTLTLHDHIFFFFFFFFFFLLLLLLLLLPLFFFG